MAVGEEHAGTIDDEREEQGGPFEADVDQERAAELRAARLDAFLDRIEAAPPGSCPCCGRPF